MEKVKQFVKQIMPPAVINATKFLLRKIVARSRYQKWEYEYIPQGWGYATVHPEVKGWNIKEVLEAYKTRWSIFMRELQDNGSLGISIEPEKFTQTDLVSHNITMIYAYALSLACQHKSSISMLDWGGGLGHYYFLGKKLVPDLKIDYYCKEVPVIIEYGRALSNQMHFCADEACLTRQYDFVLASGSLQYSQEWLSLLKKLTKVTAGYLLVTSLPIVHHSPAFVFIQRPYQYGYNAEYLAWCLNRSEFLRGAEASGLELIREFNIGHRPFIYRAPDQCDYRGFLFRTE